MMYHRVGKWFSVFSAPETKLPFESIFHSLPQSAVRVAVHNNIFAKSYRMHVKTYEYIIMDTDKCQNYRAISLPDSAYKMYPEQMGFSKGRCHPQQLHTIAYNRIQQ